MALFTPEELAALRLIDEEIDEDFRQTQEEIVESRKRDRKAELEAMDPKDRKIAAQKAAYREANKEKIADYQAAYREANKEKIADYQAAYREANKEKIAAKRAENREAYNAYMREYMRKRRLKMAAM